MSASPLVSVIVPAYNAARFLAQTLASVQAQTHPHWEAIVVDDGSIDDTAVIARRFATQDPRFVVLQQANAGVSAARNTALAQARGDWIAFLDADDVWFPQKIERQLQLAAQDAKANLLFTNYYLWDGARDLGERYVKRKHFPCGDVARCLIFFNLFGMSTVMVTRRTLQQAGGFDPRFTHAEDWDVWLRMARHGLWARGVEEPLARYRVWESNASKATVKMAEANLQVLELRAADPPPARLRCAYRQALRIARGHLALARVRPLLDTTPDAARAAVWRAWRHCPGRLKWLLWSGALIWPAWLGGDVFARRVYDKIRAKW